MQIAIIGIAANGPFVDEGLYIVAGLRVLEGQGLSDGYGKWFNGSPFVWPVIAAVGYQLGGLAGARLMAAILSTATLIVFAWTAERLLGRRASEWGALALGLNGLFAALAHFAVYDVPALTGLAVSMCCVTRTSTAEIRWSILAGIAFAAAVIAKYSSMAMVLPLVGLLVSVRGVERSTIPCAAFLGVSGSILAAYFWTVFGTPFPTSADTYLARTFGRNRSHIALLQAIFALAPLALMVAGAIVAGRRHQRQLVVTCALALSLYPVFHLWSANFVSGQKHVVAGFLFAYLLAGVALEQVWASRRSVAVAVLAMLTVWGSLQCYWQDRSWSDIRPLARHLLGGMKRGDRVVAESSWSYTMYLYPMGLIDTPAAVIDANNAPARDRQDICAIPWLVGNPESAELVRVAAARCPHQRVRTLVSWEYYFDTDRLRVAVHPTTIALYHLP